MKFLLFADYHYAPGRFKSCEWEGLELLKKHAVNAGCDMVIHCGDFCHNSEIAADFIEAYNNFPMPAYHCLGNHDMDGTSIEETLKHYRMPNDYYSFDMGGYRFIVTNTGYYTDEGEFVVFSNSNYFKHPDTRETLPPKQLEWLEKTVNESPYPCLIFSHSSYERPDGARNRDKVLDIINKANAKKPHSVLMCLNGHHHRDNIRILDNVIYFDVNSSSFDWVGESYKHDLYPEDECAAIKNLSKTVCYNDPLHAIITLEGTTVTIEGMESSMYMGVNRKEIGAPEFDKAGRPVVPRIQSAKITLG